MILEGLVTVNGVPATLGMKADLERDHIKVSGKLLSAVGSKVYIMLNKPVKYLTSMSDTEKRPIVRNLIKRVKARVFPVGRLDYNTEGLLVMTNDGDLANAILHPKNKIPKTYLAKIDGFLDDSDISKLEKGIRLEDGMTAPAKVRRVRTLKANSWVEITIHEGRKRQVRRMFERVKHPVSKLVRTKVNGLTLSNLKPGEFRYLSPDEVKKLKGETMKSKGGKLK